MKHLPSLKRQLYARLRMLACATLAVAAMQIGGVSAQNISTVAGDGTIGFGGDGGPATSARLNEAYGVAIDAAGNRYIADTYNFRIRKVTPAGIISTAVGTGVRGFSGDGGPATSAQIDLVYRVTVDASGGLYLADYGNNRIRKVSSAGTISTVVGTAGFGFSGDGGPATSARVFGPTAIAFDATGNMYFSDYNNHRIRKIDTAGIISTVAGNGTRGFSGDGGPATLAQTNYVLGISATSTGVLYLADFENSRIRRVGTDGVISTVAGTGAAKSDGDGGSANSAAVHRPWDVAVDSIGGYYIADTDGQRVRYVSPAGIIRTVAGNGTFGFNGDGGPATSAWLAYPLGLAVGKGQLLIVDRANNRVRLVPSITTSASVATVNALEEEIVGALDAGVLSSAIAQQLIDKLAPITAKLQWIAANSASPNLASVTSDTCFAINNYITYIEHLTRLRRLPTSYRDDWKAQLAEIKVDIGC